MGTFSECEQGCSEDEVLSVEVWLVGGVSSEVQYLLFGNMHGQLDLGSSDGESHEKCED